MEVLNYPCTCDVQQETTRRRSFLSKAKAFALAVFSSLARVTQRTRAWHLPGCRDTMTVRIAAIGRTDDSLIATD